jgi:hypothetical protein
VKHFYTDRERCKVMTEYLSLGRRRGGNWANKWRWTKSIIVHAMNRCPDENHMSVPFPVHGKLRCFCKDRWTDGNGSFCSQSWLFCEWTDSTFWQALIEGNNKCRHRSENCEVKWQIFTQLLNWTTAYFFLFRDAILHTFKFLKSGFVWYIMVSKNNRRLEVRMSL